VPKNVNVYPYNSHALGSFPRCPSFVEDKCEAYTYYTCFHSIHVYNKAHVIVYIHGGYIPARSLTNMAHLLISQSKSWRERPRRSKVSRSTSTSTISLISRAWQAIFQRDSNTGTYSTCISLHMLLERDAFYEIHLCVCSYLAPFALCARIYALSSNACAQNHETEQAGAYQTLTPSLCAFVKQGDASSRRGPHA
jgi:hypothetical protein